MTRKITAINLQKRNLKRVNIFLDDNFAFGISRIKAEKLTIGQYLNTEEILELQTTDVFELAYQQALNFLSYRTRSEKEILTNLKKHDYSDDVTSVVLEKLIRNNLVNDVEFARSWVENRSEFRPRGHRALKMELYQKGINNEIIDEVIRNINEEELAYTAAIKQSRKYKLLNWKDFKKKMFAFLTRRGFGYEVSANAVNKSWEDVQAGFPQENL
jgi:regulatory protein